MNRLEQIHKCLIASSGKCIRNLKTPKHGDTLEWWSANGKTIIIQYWGEHDSVSVYRPLQDQNNMNKEIECLDKYINF